jgi:hypothetical protein
MDRVSGCIDCVLVLPPGKGRDGERMVRSKITGIEGAQANRPLSPFDGKLCFAHPRKGDGAQGESEDIGIAEFQCAIKQLECGNCVMLEVGEDMRGDRKRRCIVTAVRNRRTGMLNRSNAV